MGVVVEVGGLGEAGEVAAVVGELARIAGTVEAAQADLAGLCFAHIAVGMSADHMRLEERTAGCDSTHYGSAESMRHSYTAGVRQHQLYIGASSAHDKVRRSRIGSLHS